MIFADMDVEYLDHMGDDLSVVNAARVSFYEEHGIWIDGKDDRLVSYLAKHAHWSPFAHSTVKFRVTAPIFVARQLAKHQVGFAWNEVSRRYVDSKIEFYLPEGFRAKADNVKQGSSADIVRVVGGEDLWNPLVLASTVNEQCFEAYEMLIRGGVCAEQARMVLPQNTMTTWIWTGSLYGWARVCKLRLDSHTQKETRDVAKMINAEMQALFPVSWKALMFDEKKEKVCALLS